MISISSEKSVNLNSANTSPFTEQYIWGHRIFNEQPPECIFLEFLCILLSHKDHPLRAKHGGVSYSVKRYMPMRELIFKNPYLDNIDRDDSLDNSGKWKKWGDKFCQEAQWFNKNNKEEFLSNLKYSFQTIGGDENSFRNFANLIYLLREISFGLDNDKRWTSNYIFPVGPNAIYTDCNIEGKQDKNIFARTGELLYLMLSRSNIAEDLGTKLVEIFLSEKNPLNSCLKIFQDPTDDESLNNPASMYLPEGTDYLFNQLADDWNQIIDLQMPSNDKIYNLCQLTPLYFIIYILIRANEVLEKDCNIDIVCEIVSTTKTKLRTLAADRFVQNNTLSLKALEKFINSIKEDKKWIENKHNGTPTSNIKLLCEYFKIKKNDKSEYDSTRNEDAAVDLLLQKSVKNHKKHLGAVHLKYGKYIGLVSSIRTNRTRYILSDQLLKTLVYTNVKKRMELHDFLEILYKKYHIIIGQKEGEKYIKSRQCEAEDFGYNLRVLEKRLEALGLLLRLSDSYSYVQNPFS